MSVHPISRIDQIQRDKPDDLFICSTSFEQRCTNAVMHLGENYRANGSLIVRYFGEDADGLQSRHHDTLCTHLSPHIVNQNGMATKHFDKYDPYRCLDALTDSCKELGAPERITIDITTFTKVSLLYLLGFLRERYPHAILRMLYTKGIYSPNEPLTWGVKDISLLPHFGKKWQDKGNSVLVLLLGYEDDRAYGIRESIDPRKTIAVIADPPTYAGADKPSKAFNAAILNDPETTIVRRSAMDPLETKEMLSAMYRSKDHEGLGFFIAPLGTKMQVVGVYLFFEEEIHPHIGSTRAQIVYSRPAKYNEKNYTIHYEDKQVWEFILDSKRY